MTNQVFLHCKNCGKDTLHIQPSTSHVLHLLLSFVTLGLWLIVWFFVAQNNKNQGVCTVCGTERGLFGTGPGKAKFHRPPPLEETYVHCPDCKELVLEDALVCKHCHRKLTPDV